MQTLKNFKKKKIGFLEYIPKSRTTLDRPKGIKFESQQDAFKNGKYYINQKVNIEAIKWYKNGNLCVLINNKHLGFIKLNNIHFEINIGNYLIGYIKDINYKGNIEIIFEKPNFWNKMGDCMNRIINILKYCNGTIDLYDKSVNSEIINIIFQMSKKDFKKASGMLYKENVIRISK